MEATCSIEGCEGEPIARGWCGAHYKRWRRHGDPRAGRPSGRTTYERFEAKIERTPDCWEWVGGRNKDGYGSFWNGEHRDSGTPIMVLAHRWAYESFIGPIPDGLYVLHHCDNPGCVNPNHLFTGTQADNVRDCEQKGRRNQARSHPNWKRSA